MTSSTLSHPHDVSIIWEFWPFDVMIPSALRVFLTGYGINPVFTWMYDISYIPMQIWDGFWNFVAWPINSIFSFLWGLVNFLTSGLVATAEVEKFFVGAWRKLVMAPYTESMILVIGVFAYYAVSTLDPSLLGLSADDGQGSS